jgi:DNA repair protein RecO (recombination protein O)
MHQKTTAIVLHTIKHKDSATIVTLYTRQFGRVSYLVHGINKKKSIVRAAYLQALSIIEIDVFHNSKKSIQQIKDLHTTYTFVGIPYDPIKNALALFIAEILYRSLKQTEPDENIFLFLENAIQQLDHCETGISNFHLVFMVKLSRFLGFAPNVEETDNRYFDLMNGVFLSQKPLHAHCLMPDITADFAALLRLDFSTMDKLVMGRQKRVKLLESLVEYYRLHVPEFHGLHSLAVLQSLFD